MNLFSGAVRGDDRIKAIINMMNHHPDEFNSDVMRDFAASLLRKAEREAEHWLLREISECLRGERDAQIAKQYTNEKPRRSP